MLGRHLGRRCGALPRRRLLRADANPGELIWEAVAYGAPRAEFGWGHSIASLTDCLTMTDDYAGDEEDYYFQRPRLTGDEHGQAPMLWTAEALLR